MAANKEILVAEIDDSAFSEFKKKFDAYEAAVKAMPPQWQAAGTHVAAHKNQFERLAANASALYRSLERATIEQSASSRLFDASAGALAGMARSGRQFASSIRHATASLRHWTKLTAVFSGLLGAGGLFGISRMAESVARQRISAAGLGVSYGEQASFLTNFWRLGNAEGVLRGFSEAEIDVSKRYALRQYLGHAESGDPARDFAEGLLRFKALVDKTPQQLLGPTLQQRGYEKLGIGIETARIVKGTPRSELEQLSRDYGADLATRLGLPPDIAKKWTNLATQMERAGSEIGAVFAKGFVKLTGPLARLSDAFIGFAEKMLKEGGPIVGWLKGFGSGIKRFADELGSGDLQKKAADIGRDIDAIIQLIEATSRNFPLGAGIAVGTLLRGAATGVAGAIAGVPGAGAAVAVGGTAWLMNKLMPQHPELLRRSQEYENAGGSPASPHPTMTRAHQESRERTRKIFGHPHREPQNWTPDSGRPAPQGTPWNRIYHPRRYQGKMTIDGQSFDYASGSENRGRGSSPFGDHPITMFDPAAMHGRGGGAFRTADVVDPQTGDKRGAVEIHMSRQSDISKVETAGCFGIPQSEWGGAKAALLRYMKGHGGATLRVHPNGQAEVIPGHSQLANYSQKDRRTVFGHPSLGHHPATKDRAQRHLMVYDNTGGLVTVGAH
jgi:hypothetical protein